MYEQFFGLNRPPFKITPDTSLFYDGGRRGDVLGALVYAVQRGEGIVKVVGEVGSGKTMLCRMLQQELPESVEIVYIANPSVSPDDILFVIAHELKLNVEKDASKHEVMHLLQSHLLSRFTGNRQVVLFVEEAQGMPLETLEEIRLLSNLETDQDKLLQIILFGQPELDENLKISSIRQLKERVTHEFNLTPLTEKEIHQYLNFRMREVGYTGPELIGIKVAKIVAKYSGGLLRRINIIADKVLLSAFAENTHNISVKHVNAAVQDSGFERSIDGQLTGDNKGVYLLLSLLLVIIVLAWLFLSGKGALLFASSLQGSTPTVIVAEAKMKNLKKVPNGVLGDAIQRQKPNREIQANSVKPVVTQVVQEDGSKVVPSQDNKEEKESAVEVELTSESLKKESDDKLAVIISRKKKNSDGEVLLNKEESHKNNKLLQKSLSISQETTRINNNIAQKKDVKVVLEANPVGYDDGQWLENKLKHSKSWLNEQANRGVSIQVMMRSSSASKELTNVLRNKWPLDVDRTHLYEVEMNGGYIYRVFYGGYSSLSLGQKELKKLPEELRLNNPYLHSIYKMKKTLL